MGKLLPEIIESERLREIVYEVVKDIHTSPQNDITKFPDYECSSFAVLWNLMNSERYDVTKVQLIQISLQVDELRKAASRLLTLQIKKGDVVHSTVPIVPVTPTVVRTEFGKLPKRKKSPPESDYDLINDFENQKHVFISKKMNTRKK